MMADGPFCSCNPGWSGDNCDVSAGGTSVQACTLECNHGACVMDSVDGFHFCECEDDWKGSDCTTPGPVFFAQQIVNID